MQVPLEFSTRDLPDTTSDHAKEMVREQVAKLEHQAQDIIACRVAVERPQHNQRSGNQYRVRIETTLAPGKRLVVSQEPTDNDPGDSLRHVVKSAFDAMRRQIKAERERRRGDVKSHAVAGGRVDEAIGFVVRMFPMSGYGFIQSVDDGHDVYFHHHSVIHNDFERLAVGTQVRYVETLGEKGPQASTVQLIDKPGERLQPPEESEIQAPAGWERQRNE